MSDRLVLTGALRTRLYVRRHGPLGADQGLDPGYYCCSDCIRPGHQQMLSRPRPVVEDRPAPVAGAGPAEAEADRPKRGPRPERTPEERREARAAAVRARYRNKSDRPGAESRVRRLLTAEQKAGALDRRARGESHRTIAMALGVSKTSIGNLLLKASSLPGAGDQMTSAPPGERPVAGEPRAGEQATLTTGEAPWTRP